MFKKSQRGFTLVELSIVLVIIGLIVGGVLTGQQIIQNARITNTVNAIQAYQAQFQTYVQNYGALPGDDSSAEARFPNSSVTNGGGDGTLGNDSSFASTANSGAAADSRFVWAHLRAAELVKSQTPADAQPKNPFGGVFGFQTNAFSNAISGTVLCLDSVPGNAAQAIDTRIDDGDSDAGTLRASQGISDAPVANYVDDQNYILCTRI